MLLDRACDIIERGPGARRGGDKVQVVQKRSEVLPLLQAALRQGIMLRQGGRARRL